ncbi:MAG: addiction module protein [Pseudomonadota bacterium]
MSSNADEIFKTALELTASERAEVAALLLESLDSGSDEGVDEAWRVEVERRMKELDSGAVKTVSWAEARERLYQGLNA